MRRPPRSGQSPSAASSPPTTARAREPSTATGANGTFFVARGAAHRLRTLAGGTPAGTRPASRSRRADSRRRAPGMARSSLQKSRLKRSRSASATRPPAATTSSSRRAGAQARRAAAGPFARGRRASPRRPRDELLVHPHWRRPQTMREPKEERDEHQPEGGVDEHLKALVWALRVREPLEERVAKDLEVHDVQRQPIDDPGAAEHEPIPQQRRERAH